MSKKIQLTLLLIISLITAPYVSNAQLFKSKESKKLLKQQVETLTRQIDSLKGIIEGGTIEMSDTTTFDESSTSYEELALIDSLVFENATPGF